MISIATRRLHLLIEALTSLGLSAFLAGAAYLYPTATTHPLVAKVAGSIVFGSLSLVALVHTFVRLRHFAKRTAALRADEHGIEFISTAGRTNFYSWKRVTAIGIKQKREHRSRGPDVVWQALVLEGETHELDSLDENICACDLAEVVKQLQTLPEASARISQEALQYRAESPVRKLFSLRRLYLTALVCFIAYLTYRYWLLTH